MWELTHWLVCIPKRKIIFIKTENRPSYVWDVVGIVVNIVVTLGCIANVYDFWLKIHNIFQVIHIQPEITPPFGVTVKITGSTRDDMQARTKKGNEQKKLEWMPFEVNSTRTLRQIFGCHDVRQSIYWRNTHTKLEQITSFSSTRNCIETPPTHRAKHTMDEGEERQRWWRWSVCVYTKRQEEKQKCISI